MSELTETRWQDTKSALLEGLTGNKKADLFLGRTRAGTLTRVGATQDRVKNVLGGALKKAGGGSGVVGRRSAGGFTAS